MKDFDDPKNHPSYRKQKEPILWAIVGLVIVLLTIIICHAITTGAL